MHILFYDVATPATYDLTTLRQQGLGGTEATIIRIAHALKNHHSISIAQHCRATSANQCCAGVNYLSLETAKQLKPDVVILLRHYRLLAEVGQLFPEARKYLWLHNLPSRELYSLRPDFLKHQFEIIAVSQFHREIILKRLRGKWLQTLFLPEKAKEALPPVHVLYNPIDEELHPDHTAWDPKHLLFMSSPQKGLAETLKTFEKLTKYFPEYQLLISNPGYNHSQMTLPKQAHFLGSLPHPEVIQQLRQSFCVFYPQTVRVETFGLVYAEANAVGTPVLAHDSGAASEVLSDPGQLVDGRKLSSIRAKLNEWREKRPVLKAKPEFRLNKVTERWLGLLRS